MFKTILNKKILMKNSQGLRDPGAYFRTLSPTHSRSFPILGPPPFSPWDPTSSGAYSPWGPPSPPREPTFCRSFPTLGTLFCTKGPTFCRSFLIPAKLLSVPIRRRVTHASGSHSEVVPLGSEKMCRKNELNEESLREAG